MAPIFIKFDQIEGEAEQSDHKIDMLARGFEDLGGAFIKLVFDATSETGDLKITPALAELKIKHDLLLVGHDFIKIGLAFDRLDGSQIKWDQALIKFSDQVLKIGPQTEEGGNPLASEFLKYETDIKATAADFIKFGTQIKLDTFDIKFFDPGSLSLAFQTLSDDFIKLGNDNSGIGFDFKLLSRSTDSEPLHKAFLDYGDAAIKVGAVYLKIASDWKVLAGDFTPNTDFAATIKLTQVLEQHADDFIKLTTDFQTLNTDLKFLGGDTLKIADAIETTGHQLVFKTSSG